MPRWETRNALARPHRMASAGGRVGSLASALAIAARPSHIGHLDLPPPRRPAGRPPGVSNPCRPAHPVARSGRRRRRRRAESVLALRSLAGDRVSVELLAPGADFAHRPFSVRSPFTGEPGAPDLVRPRAGQASPRRAGRGRRRSARGPHDRRRPLPYDRLIIATGAQPVEAVHGADLFRGPVSAGAVEACAAAGAAPRDLHPARRGELDAAGLRARAAGRARASRATGQSS